MNPQLPPGLQSEVELVARFSESYRRKFDEVIARLNAAVDSQTDAESLRLCVEAVDMMLSSHAVLARALVELMQQKQPMRLNAA